MNSTQKAEYVREMFSRIAPRYDLMNRLMTLGQDGKWRKEVVKRAQLTSGARLLDLGCGTGDLALEALKQCPECESVATDFTIEMMLLGKERQDSIEMHIDGLNWVAADATGLPYPSETFDAVVSGFLMRNLTNILLSLQQQYRVLKPGGVIVVLDTTPPPKNIFAPLIRFHLHTIIPSMGKLIAGNADAYEYLPDSTEHFLEPEQLAGRLLRVGFRNVAFRRLMFGTIAIHWGQK